MIPSLIKQINNKVFSFARNKAGSALVEFALVVGLFLFLVLSALELMLIRTYVTFAESAVVKGVEIGFDKTKLTNGGQITTYNRLDPTTLIKASDIQDSIPKVLNFFTDGAPTITIKQVHNYNNSGLALHSHRAYECLVEANWKPFSPYILFATSGGVMPLKIKANFNDY